jgi:hypothetical protein
MLELPYRSYVNAEERQFVLEYTEANGFVFTGGRYVVGDLAIS